MLGKSCHSSDPSAFGLTPLVPPGTRISDLCLPLDPPPFLCAGLQSEGPVQEVQAAEEGLDRQLILAVVGSVSATCLTILAALLTLVCIRRSCLRHRRTFTYQSGSVSACACASVCACTCACLSRA